MVITLDLRYELSRWLTLIFTVTLFGKLWVQVKLVEMINYQTAVYVTVVLCCVMFGR
jgi:hypothetical protein